MWASEAEEEEPENDQSYRDVEPIALFGKRPNRECDAGNRRGDQEQQAQLDNSRGVPRAAFRSDQSYRDVEPIALFGKRPNRECDAGNRRGDQEQQAQLDNSRGVQRDAFSNNSGNMPQIAGFAAKRSIVYW